MAINLASKFSPLCQEEFKLESLTDAFAGSKYKDFDGVNTVKIYTIDTVGVNDYNRSASGNRFGNIKELGDAVQTLVLTQDKALEPFSIDKGNAQEQFNVKHCAQQLKANWDNVVIPLIDKYRIKKWADGAGLGVINATALTKSNIIEAIMECNALMSNKRCPKRNKALFIGESLYVKCKLASEVTAIDSLGEKSIVNGAVGTIDNTYVVPVPDDYLPAGVNFIIKWKDASVDPMTLKTMRVQTDPLGIDGNVGECRFIHDSFVLDTKINGICVHAKEGMCAAPTGDNGTTAGGKVTLNCATGGATIKYTTDGSNPKTSATAVTYSAAFTTPASGSVVRAYASKAGLVNSAVFELEIS